jgi:hypothetical protein
MRTITIGERNFRHFVWPAIAYQPVDNGGEVDSHVRLLRKVKAVSTEVGESSGDNEIVARILDSTESKFCLEEDEWGRMKKCLEKWLPRVAGGVLDTFKDLQDSLKNAEQEEAVVDA